MKNLSLLKVSALLNLIAVLGSVSHAQADPLGIACPNSRSKKDTPIMRPTLFEFKNNSISKLFKVNAFGSSFKFPVRCALGDFNSDGTHDVVVAGGPGASSTINVIDGKTRKPMKGSAAAFSAFEPSFRGGVYVATGDVSGDGIPDIIAAAGASTPVVKVFNGSTGETLKSFFAYDVGFTGGVRVAAGDVNNDGVADIITGPGNSGSPPVVKIFNGSTGDLISSFNAYDASFKGGVYVAAGDVNGDGVDDIVTGAGAGGGPHVKAFNGSDNALLQSFFAYPTNFKGGVSVATGDVNGDNKADIITAPAQSGKAEVKVFDGANLAELGNLNIFSKNFNGGVSLGARSAFFDSNNPEPTPTTAPTATPSAKSYIEILDELDIESFNISPVSGNCGLNGVLSARILGTTIRFSNLPGNGDITFTKQNSGVYTATGVVVLGQPAHDGTFDSEGCNSTFGFTNTNNNGQCSAIFHFNPIGTAAESYLTNARFANCP